MPNGKVLWGKLAWWLAVNAFVVGALFLAGGDGTALGALVAFVSIVVWLIVWRRSLSLAEKAIASEGVESQ